jgi:hypothetical protein
MFASQVRDVYSFRDNPLKEAARSNPSVVMSRYSTNSGWTQVAFVP